MADRDAYETFDSSFQGAGLSPFVGSGLSGFATPGGGSPRDSTPPTVTGLVSGQLGNKVTPLVFQVVDANPGVGMVTISIRYAGLLDYLTVYDGIQFLGLFVGTSTVTPLIGGGLQFSILPQGGWRDAFVLRMPGIDLDGQIVDL